MTVIDEYLARVAKPQRDMLLHIRDLVKQTVPDAEEVISYGMPGFKLRHKYMLGFAPFRGHMSLFPTSGPVAAFQDELKDFTLARGTIQFTVEQPIPEELLKKIIAHRVRAIAKN